MTPFDWGVVLLGFGLMAFLAWLGERLMEPREDRWEDDECN